MAQAAISAASLSTFSSASAFSPPQRLATRSPSAATGCQNCTISPLLPDLREPFRHAEAAFHAPRWRSRPSLALVTQAQCRLSAPSLASPSPFPTPGRCEDDSSTLALAGALEKPARRALGSRPPSSLTEEAAYPYRKATSDKVPWGGVAQLVRAAES